MDFTVPKPRAIDLFSGAGGLTQGLKDAGFNILAAVEIEKVARSTYRVNHPEVGEVWENILDVSGQEIMAKLGIKPGELELLAGCPPCQGFSSIRTKNLKVSVQDHRNNLIFRFLRLVKELRPQAVMMENVPGLAKDKRMKYVMRFLEKWGYYAGEDALKVLNAEDYGVPQRRRRMILITSLKGPIPWPAKQADKKTVRETIERLPLPDKSSDPLHNVQEKRTERIMEMIRSVPKDGGSRADLDEKYHLECHKNFDGFSDVYGRMSWDKVSPTITSGFFNPSKGRFIHPEQDRAITPREAALLQGFSENYFFSLERGKSFCASMIGNALPPEFVRQHALQIRNYGIEVAGA